MQATNTRPRFEVVADGQGVCSHVGAALLGELSDRLGLTGERGRRANLGVRAGAYDRGQVLRDLVVMLADGGDCVSDLASLRNQPELFGQVVSTPTAWRILAEELPADPRGISGLWSALARVRERTWALGAAPAGPLILDLDATLVEAHSDKQGAAPTYKHGDGFHPLGCWLDRGDGTGEALGQQVRQAAQEPRLHLARGIEAQRVLVGGDLRGRHPFVEHGLVSAEAEVGHVPEGADQLVEDGDQEVDRGRQRGDDRRGDAPPFEHPGYGVGAKLRIGGDQGRRVPGPRIVRPRDDARVSRDHVVVVWKPARTPPGVEIVGYQVVVTREEPLRVLSVDLPASARRLPVPPVFLQRGIEYKAEVLAVEASGNQTLTEVAFTVK